DPGAVHLRVTNSNAEQSDKVGIEVSDALGLVKPEGGAGAPSLAPGASETLSIKLVPNYPPRPIGLSDENWPQQQWQNHYPQGVDLAVRLYSEKPNAEASNACTTPLALFKGHVDSCSDGKRDGDEAFTDGSGSCPCHYGKDVVAAGWSDVNGFVFANTPGF